MKNKLKKPIIAIVKQLVSYRVLTLLFFFISVSFTIPTLAQEQKLTLKFKDKPLSEILDQIEKKSGYSFLVRSNDVNLKEIVSIDVVNKSVVEVLNQLFKQNQINYEITGKSISIFKPQKSQNTSNTANKTKKLTGLVTDEKGEPIIGASILIKGQSKGTVTDLKGKFQIDVASDATLIVSYIGYIPKTVAIENKDFLKIVISEDSRNLDEVVVVGYGTMKKINMTGAVSTVKMDETIASRSLTNVSSGLTGLVPGLSAISNSGMAGSNGASLLIRGMGTVNNANPLIVVDGMPDVDINRINMNDIETISVLKDAASSAVYGSRAANGVILITTKTGKNKGKPQFSYTGSYAMSKATNFYDYLADYPRALTLAIQAAGAGNSSTNYRWGTVEEWMSKSMIDPILYPNTNWANEIFRTGAVQNHTISASGATDVSNFYISLGELDEKGLLINNDYKRYNFRTNIDYKLKKNLQVGTRIDAQSSNRIYAGQPNGMYNSALANPFSGDFEMQYAIAGILPKNPITGQSGGVMAYGEDVNALNMLQMYSTNYQRSQRVEANASLFLDWEIIKGLKVRGDYAIRYYNDFIQGWSSTVPLVNFQTGLTVRTVNPNVSIANTFNQGYKTLVTGRVNYDKEIFKGHTIALMAAVTEEYWNDKYAKASRMNPLNPNLIEIDAAMPTTQSAAGNSSAESLRSYIGRINYSMLNKYLFEANFRYDGSSKFLPGKQFGFFPSVALGWRISEENFFKPLSSVVSNAKLRASYGALGNNSGVGRYDQREVYDLANYSMANSIIGGLQYKRMINPYLTWETTTVANIGLDLGFFNNNLTAEFDIYDRLTSNMIRPSDLSTLLAGYIAPPRNIGNLRNRGAEMNINWHSSIQKLKYGVNLNASYNINRLEKWNEYLSTGDRFINMPYNFLYPYVAYGVAQSWNDLYNSPYQGSNVSPGDIYMKDLNGDGQITSADRKAIPQNTRYMGSLQAGLNLNVEYIGFDLSVLFQASSGRMNYWLDAFNATNVPATRYAYQAMHWNDSWSIQNRNALLPRLVSSQNGGTNQLESTYWLENMSYLRLKNLQFGYNVPKNILSKLYVDALRIFLSAEDLLTFSKWKGIDPEKQSQDPYPLVQTTSLGINITF